VKFGIMEFGLKGDYSTALTPSRVKRVGQRTGMEVEAKGTEMKEKGVQKKEITEERNAPYLYPA